MRKFSVAVTGGIGSGKTSVTNKFNELGVAVIDTDLIAHDLTQKNVDVLVEIKNIFGNKVFNGDTLSREKLREIVFRDEDLLRSLERILHPRIRQDVKTKLQSVDSEYAIVAIPLLSKKSDYDFIDRILVIDCEERIQIQRVISRNGFSEELVRSIMSKQLSRRDRNQLADDLIENNADIDSLYTKIEKLHLNYLSFARKIVRENRK
ncbi:MAG: dephospho-CoA kinase [Betaproteobacteria bacterium]